MKVIITLFPSRRQFENTNLKTKYIHVYYSTNETASKSLKIELLDHRSHSRSQFLRVLSVKDDYL